MSAITTQAIVRPWRSSFKEGTDPYVVLPFWSLVIDLQSWVEYDTSIFLASDFLNQRIIHYS
jgi:hypothetical protein